MMSAASLPTALSRAGGRSHAIAIFTIALAVLAYQVLLTRLFNVMIYYHFAFAGVSLVMLGLTIGAERVYLQPQRYTPERLGEEWARAANVFALTSVLCVLFFVYVPIVLPDAIAMQVVIGSIILFAFPMVQSGICITLILMRSPYPTGKLYAADLIGAATGCIVVVALLFLFDPISISFAIAAIVATSACLLAPKGSTALRNARALAVALGLAGLVQASLYTTGHDHLRLVWAKTQRQQDVIFERWNALSRIGVVPYETTEIGKQPGPFGWGFGHRQTRPIPQFFLDIDAGAATVITRFDGRDLTPFAFLGNDIINMGYHIRAPKTVAVIGVGGGRDIMSALFFGAAHVTGLEINPAIFEVLTDRFADFTGHLDRRPDVSLINTEARSWLNASDQRFDLLQISLIDTWAATAAGGLTMSENRLYTVDAWKEFMARLTPAGLLSVSRWFDPVSHKAEFYRLLSLAAETMKARGVPDAEIRSHILAFAVNRIVTVVVSPSPFTSAELTQARAAAIEEGFTVMLDPGSSWDETSAVIASGGGTPAFYDQFTDDLTAPTDNRPFFFYALKPLKSLFGSGVRDAGSSVDTDLALRVVSFLLISTLVSVCLLIVNPLRKVAREVPLGAMLPQLAYFAAIGVGFMLIEISQMQRLMVFLGNPTYGLTVLLFTLLLFGGLGSTTVDATKSAGSWCRPALCCVVLILVGIMTPVVADALREFGVSARVLASIALLAPAGFFMGMMFPVGMALSRKFQAHQAWFWGVNGATSVFASVLGMVVSMQYGIAQAYWMGVVCYGACVLLVLRNERSGAAIGHERSARPAVPALSREGAGV